MTSETYHHIFR